MFDPVFGLAIAADCLDVAGRGHFATAVERYSG
jgi:hypothetical protein